MGGIVVYKVGKNNNVVNFIVILKDIEIVKEVVKSRILTLEKVVVIFVFVMIFI